MKNATVGPRPLRHRSRETGEREEECEISVVLAQRVVSSHQSGRSGVNDELSFGGWMNGRVDDSGQGRVRSTAHPFQSLTH